ncbi:GSU2403 family nucleotidyltransferase fold protein [Phenylobacterium sp.]|uniref:GSU2403 family nucleotidyltransferase fold protein n=1 Tax=Phenylobacterium sp. TaxID=1871053 RepID=UPI0027263554|nr:GSU2403 family nucleotidyltransferase fold protein [Phenylobacterium sp.]MDO8801732.1 GSU2403 family nucleotidyltransferase fold protein [Phenylobacterium sp.]
MSGDLLAETAKVGRALRLPLLASEAGEIAREADRRRLLGSQLLVVGTNAVVAYSLEAAGFIREAPMETQDFDLAWASTEPSTGHQVVWEMLKAVDPTFTVNMERAFQARNSKAYEVELLVAPSRSNTLAIKGRPRPVPLPEQEWLLNGRSVDHVAICRDGSPARIVAPDPRWFALQKLWMSRQTKRNPLKQRKDEAQGLAILDAVVVAMPHYPLDADFEASLPLELVEIYSDWDARRPETPSRKW